MAEVGDYFFIKSADLFESGVPVFKEEVEVLYEETTGDEGARSSTDITLPVGKVLEDYNSIRVGIIRPSFHTQAGSIADFGGDVLNARARVIDQQLAAIDRQIDTLSGEQFLDISESRQQEINRQTEQLFETADQLIDEFDALDEAFTEITFGRGTTIIFVPLRFEAVAQEFSVAQMKANANAVTLAAGFGEVRVTAQGSGSTMRFTIDGSLGGGSSFVRKVWGVRLVSGIYEPPEEEEDEDDGDDS